MSESVEGGAGSRNPAQSGPERFSRRGGWEVWLLVTVLTLTVVRSYMVSGLIFAAAGLAAVIGLVRAGRHARSGE